MICSCESWCIPRSRGDWELCCPWRSRDCSLIAPRSHQVSQGCFLCFDSFRDKEALMQSPVKCSRPHSKGRVSRAWVCPIRLQASQVYKLQTIHKWKNSRSHSRNKKWCFSQDTQGYLREWLSDRSIDPYGFKDESSYRQQSTHLLEKRAHLFIYGMLGAFEPLYLKIKKEWIPLHIIRKPLV